MANRYWVGGGSAATWAATGNTNWGTASNTQDNAAVPTSADDVFFDGVGTGASNCTIGAAATCKSINFTGYVNTLTHNGFNLTIAGSATFVAGMTYTPLATSTVTISATGTLTTGGKLMPLLSHTGGTLTLGDNLSFMASKVITFTLGGTTFDMNGKSINGNSATNRVLIRATTLGTAKTITNATTSFTNADFRDITFSSASSLDLSAITGLSGDCGGNSITGGGSTLTFTTPATQTATGSSANWSTATWTSRVPLPQDDVVLSLTAGQTLTNDMPRMGKSISLTTAMNLSCNTIAQTFYGGLNLTNVNTFTTGSTGTWSAEGRSTFTLINAGKSFSVNFTMNMIGGTLVLGDAYNSSTNGFVINAGTFDNTVNNANLTVATQIFLTSGSIFKMGNGTFTLTGTGTKFTGNGTINAGGSTIAITDTSSSSKTFNSGGLSFTFNNLTITGGGTGAIIIQGSNTFNTITINSPKNVTFTSGTTQTVSSFVATGTAGNLITLNASTGGSAATLTKTGGGTIQCDYLSITDVNVTPSSTWYYGNNSTYVSGTGWNSGSPFKGSSLGSRVSIGMMIRI